MPSKVVAQLHLWVVEGLDGGPEDAKMNPSIGQSGSLLFAR
jgi:hypothetical protein